MWYMCIWLNFSYLYPCICQSWVEVVDGRDSKFLKVLVDIFASSVLNYWSLKLVVYKVHSCLDKKDEFLNKWNIQ